MVEAEIKEKSQLSYTASCLQNCKFSSRDRNSKSFSSFQDVVDNTCKQ